MNTYWYEVFMSNKEGTQTLFSCGRLKECREFKRKYNKLANAMGETLHIDKWQNINYNPEPILEIE
jgi:hypothetical protein